MERAKRIYRYLCVVFGATVCFTIFQLNVTFDVSIIDDTRIFPQYLSINNSTNSTTGTSNDTSAVVSANDTQPTDMDTNESFESINDTNKPTADDNGRISEKNKKSKDIDLGDNYDDEKDGDKSDDGSDDGSDDKNSLALFKSSNLPLNKLTNTTDFCSDLNYTSTKYEEILKRSQEKSEKNDKKVRSKNYNVNATPPEKFYMHIPKTGGTSAQKELNSLLKKSSNPKLKRSFVCNYGNVRDYHFFKPTFETQNNGQKICSVQLSEKEYDTVNFQGSTIYTIVRDPQHHVLSQFFHCTESNVKGLQQKRKGIMPSLDDWLYEWVQQKRCNGPLAKRRMPLDRNMYGCYKPINMQSNFMGLIEEEGEMNMDTLDKYAVIGSLSKYEESICLIFIHFNDGVIPHRCNCSRDHRRLSIKNSHGVKHHATDFELSPLQLEMIKELTDRDREMYDYVNDVLFEKQVASFEERYDFTLCRSSEEDDDDDDENGLQNMN